MGSTKRGGKLVNHSPIAVSLDSTLDFLLSTFIPKLLIFNVLDTHVIDVSLSTLTWKNAFSTNLRKFGVCNSPNFQRVVIGVRTSMIVRILITRHAIFTFKLKPKNVPAFVIL